MAPMKSYKIDLTPEAHKVVKIYSAIKGRNIKELVSNLILQNYSGELAKQINEIPSATCDTSSDTEQLSEEDSDHNFPSASSSMDGRNNDHLETIRSTIAITNQSPHKIEPENSMQTSISSTAYQVYGFLSNDSTKAQTPGEIAKDLPGVSLSATQRALYWLLKQGAIQRRLRENTKDRRKNSWEYWKLESTGTFREKGVSIDSLLENLPNHKDQAISIRELAIRFDVPATTIRDTLTRLEKSGRVISLQGTNHKNQTTIKYYLPQ